MSTSLVFFFGVLKGECIANYNSLVMVFALCMGILPNARQVFGDVINNNELIHH